LNYAAAHAQADDATQRVLGEVWNSRLRASRAQGARAKAKAAPLDQKVRTI
jgi:hypothetical protein